MRYIIDRFEGDIAVCQSKSKQTIAIPRSLLPEGCREGSCVQKVEEAYQLIDNNAERERLRERMSRLFKH